MSELKSTPFEALHVALDARMVPFGGWNMPVQYQRGIIAEHHHTREHVSLFDCSHMGEFRVEGPNVAAELDAMLPRLVSTQKVGSCRYNFLLNDQGGVCDDLIVYREDRDRFYLVVNASTQEADAAIVRAHLGSDSTFTDLSATTAKLDVQGPKAAKVLQEIGVAPEALPRYYRFTRVTIAGTDVLLSRTGYTGELGYELYFDHGAAETMWQLLLDVDGLEPAGLGARDTLRLEMGYPLYGHELNEDITPLAAGFAGMLNLDRAFVGSVALAAPPTKRLVGIRFKGRRAVREGAELATTDENIIGSVTSGSFSPSLACAIAMGYVDNAAGELGQTVLGKAGKKWVTGTITELPFYADGTVRTAPETL